MMIQFCKRSAFTAVTGFLISAAGFAGSTHAAEVPAFRRYGAWNSTELGGGGYIMGVRVAASDPRIVYAWTDVGGFHRSEDGGTTWHALHGNLPTSRANYNISELIVDPRDADRFMVATGYRYRPPTGIFITDDGGLTFTQTLEAAHPFEPERWTGNTLQRDPANPDRVVDFAAGDGVFESLDNGMTWRSLGLKDRLATDVVLDRDDPRRFWVATSDYEGTLFRAGAEASEEVSFEGGLFRTTDGGRSWEELDAAPPDVTEVEQDPDRADVLYAVARNQARLAVSADGGDSWAPLDDGLNLAADPEGMHWDPSNQQYRILTADPSGVFTGTSLGTLYELDKQKQRWDRIEREGVEAPDTWWGELPGAGAPWHHLFKAACTLSISPVDPDVWFVTDWFSVWRSEDAGRTWTWSTEGIEVTYTQVIEAVPGEPDLLHLGFGDVGYFRSFDGGRTVRKGEPPTGITNNVRSISVPASRTQRVYATSCAPGGGWWAGDVFVSDDSGANWEPSPMRGLPEMSAGGHRANTILALDDAPETVFLCVSGTVAEGEGGLYRSTDGGRSWDWQDAGLPGGRSFYRANIWGGGSDLAVSPSGDAVTIKFNHQNGWGSDKVWFMPAGESRFRTADLEAWPRDVRADPHTPGRFFLATEKGPLYRSDDGGKSWQQLRLPADADQAFNVIVDRVVPDRIAMATQDGHLLSTDGGDSFAVLDRAIPHREAFGMGAFAGDHLVVGTGGSGVFWIDVSDPDAVMDRP